MAHHLKWLSTLLILLLVVVLAAKSLPDRAAEGDDSEQAVRNLEQRWLESEESPDALETILADDFVHALPFGFITKRDQIDYVRKHPVTTKSTKHFDELHVRVYGVAAIANGIVNELPEGSTTPNKTVFTDVFAKRHGVWQAVNAQELPLRARTQ